VTSLTFPLLLFILPQLVTDVDQTVQDAAGLLNRQLMDIVTKFAPAWKAAEVRDEGEETPGPFDDKAFSLARFIPLLQQHIKRSSSIYLCPWIAVLGSVTELKLIYHLPEFLDGLLLVHAVLEKIYSNCDFPSKASTFQMQQKMSVSLLGIFSTTFFGRYAMRAMCNTIQESRSHLRRPPRPFALSLHKNGHLTPRRIPRSHLYQITRLTTTRTMGTSPRSRMTFCRMMVNQAQVVSS
jgi:hypothetical protein